MKIHLLALPMLAALVACQPMTAEYTGAEAPKGLAIDTARRNLDVAFAPGSAVLSPRSAARLRELAMSGAVNPEDRVRVAAAGSPQLRDARVAAISHELLAYGIVVAPSPLVVTGPNHAVVSVGRYMVTLPPCPNWSQPPAADFTNTVSSNFGCATVTNLGLMVANPADLVSGRPLGLTDARPVVAAAQRYINESVKTPQQFDGAAASPGTTAGGLLATSGGGSK